ncbi:MAG: hypothetical protein Q8R28_09720, partial [Dehalococcoidia bacterium]|nr:hypothetical protein [Dehalococcoidia bacterium]
LDPDNPRTVDGWTPSEYFPRYRFSHCQGMQAAKRVIKEVDDEFQSVFGRSYGGLFEQYRMEDAEIVLLTVGSCTGTARVAVDRMREKQDLKVGLLKLRCVRPFPREELCRLLDGRAAVGVMDRQVDFAWNSGAVLWELRSALYDAERRPEVIGFIGGLAGADITVSDLERAIRLTADRAEGEDIPEVTWFGL